MRSRARLIEVLESTNRSAIGVHRTYCALIAEFLCGTTEIGRGNGVKLAESLIDSSPSPHIRELAAEALHYLTEDANG